MHRNVSTSGDNVRVFQELCERAGVSEDGGKSMVRGAVRKLHTSYVDSDLPVQSHQSGEDTADLSIRGNGVHARLVRLLLENGGKTGREILDELSTEK